MVLEEKIRIVDVREIDSNISEWKEITNRIKNNIQNYIGEVITIETLDKLLDSEGKKEEAWFSVTYDHTFKNTYLSYRTLPVTEERKKILRERMKERGIVRCQTKDGKFVSLEKYNEFDNSDLILYLRKVKQKEFRIGVFDINWVCAGMGIIPQTEKIQDLITINYK